MPNVDASGYVSGHYTVTWNSQDIGTTEVGFNYRQTVYKEDIKIDDYGDTIINGIVRGIQMRIDFELSKWTTALSSGIMFPYKDSTIGTIEGIGRSIIGGGYAKPMIFTPIANINSNNKTWTFPNTLAEGDVSFALNTKLRRVTVRMIAYPTEATGVLFTHT